MTFLHLPKYNNDAQDSKSTVLLETHISNDICHQDYFHLQCKGKTFFFLEADISSIPKGIVWHFGEYGWGPKELNTLQLKKHMQMAQTCTANTTQPNRGYALQVAQMATDSGSSGH